MAILINFGQRGFVLKEGYLNPGGQLTVDQETADKLTKAYPKEIKEISIEPVKGKEVVEEETKVVETAEETKEAEEPKVTAKKTSRRKKSK